MNVFEHQPEIVDEEDSGVWLSISDLMSGLLMFFALLFIVVQVQLQQEIKKAQELQRKVDKYEQLISALPIALQNALEEKLSNEYQVEVDRKTGEVKIGDRLLFDEGSAILKSEGKQFLKQFIPIYSQVIFSDAILTDYVSRIIIEGHTSSSGSDTANMELSLRRALSVSNYIFSEEVDFSTKNQFKQKLLASGRGEIDADQSKDNSSDRRVVFRFQFSHENFSELLDQIDI
ncbi:MAG: OmpA family protein [Xenococcaceae cyanobacterium MO_207.B15]|nr:OmpA family protein [Xenococcaceae cyanobacterium MO_207.B15]